MNRIMRKGGVKMCLNNSMCGCSGNRHGNGECNALGPFVAVDAACIVPTPPAQITGGTIIPFSSGTIPATLASAALGLVGLSSLVGFGTSIPGIEIAGNEIPLIGGLLSEAFTVPRAGFITSIAATFTLTAAVTLLGTSSIRAQIYQAPAGSNTFTATNAFVDLLPSLTGVIAINTILSNSATITPVPVAVGDRLLMVFSINSTAGIELANVVVGNASAGITIA